MTTAGELILSDSTLKIEFIYQITIKLKASHSWVQELIATLRYFKPSDTEGDVMNNVLVETLLRSELHFNWFLNGQDLTLPQPGLG